jgi:beta-glucanase (GH16 family)
MRTQRNLRHDNGNPTSRRFFGPRRAITIGAALTAGACLVVPGAPAPAQAAPAPASAASAVTTQVAMTSRAAAWTASRNARVTTVRGKGGRELQVKPRRSAGRKTISMRSPVSSGRVPDSGTTVTATARVRSTQAGRALTLRVLEIKDGRVVTSRSTTVKPSSRGWRRVAVALRTTRSGSRVQVQTLGQRIHGANVVRLASLNVSRSRAVPASRPAPSRSCEAIDYTDPAQGVRTFTEDFGGTTLDRSRWRVRDNTFLNQDQAWITKDAVSVHGGYLDITGKRLPQDQWRTNPSALYGAENATRDYSTGYVDSIDDAGVNRFSQRYGNFEMRAWVPTSSTMSRGIWPAFWLRGDHQVGEIDVMESYGGPTIRSFDPSSSYEWNSWADTAQGSTSDPVKQKTQGRADVGTDRISEGWHTYGVNWSPKCLRYTYDGRTVGVVDFDAPGTLPYFRGATFADTFHIRLNMQVGSKYWGWADPAHTRSEFSYKIDWVRVHQGRDLLG